MKLKYTFLSILISLLPNLQIYSLEPGDLDPTFGTNGIVTTNFNLGTSLTKLILLPNSQILAIGSTIINEKETIVIVKYNSNGSLDINFGFNGIVTTPMLSAIDVIDAATQNSEKIIVIGNNGSDTVAVRYNSNGSLDTTFGNNGILNIPIVNIQNVKCIAIQSDDKILLGGQTNSGGFFIARLNSDGTIDPTFGSGTGIVNYLNSAISICLAIQLDGKIIISGNSNTISGTEILIARLNTDGSLDKSFNNTGIVIVNISNFDFATSEIIQPDGKILSAGFVIMDNLKFPIIIRLNVDGSFDNTFGNNGIIMLGSINGSFDSIGLQNDGKIIASGTGNDGLTTKFLTVRMNPNGAIDINYGRRGIVLTDVGGNSTNSVKSMIIDPSNNLATVGGCSPCGQHSFKLVRYVASESKPFTIKSALQIM